MVGQKKHYTEEVQPHSCGKGVGYGVVLLHIHILNCVVAKPIQACVCELDYII